MRNVYAFTTFISCALAGVGNAAAQDVSVHYATALALPMTLEGKGLPATNVQTLTLAVPLSPDWIAVGRVGFATKLTLVQPAPQFQLGASWRIDDGLRLGGTLLYRYVPHWAETPSDAHVFGVTAGPIVALGPGVAISFPLGLARNFTDDVYVGTLVTELSCRLPF